MAITFNTNLAALTSQRYLGIASDKTASSLAKLSSGSRVPTAKDDAAALAVGSKLRAEVAGLNTAANNAAQAVSLLQIADGALSTVGDILVRQKALAVQSSSGQLSDNERSLLNQEFTNLRSEIDRIANITNFNGTSLLAGSSALTANTNNLSSTGTAATQGNSGGAFTGQATSGGAKNLVGEGYDSINFGSSVTADAFAFSFNADTNGLTAKNLETGQSQTVILATAAIASGATESVSFGNLDATVVLNDRFDKNVSTNTTNGYRNLSVSETSDTGGNVSNFTIKSFKLVEGGGVTAADFNQRTFTVTQQTSGSTLGGASTISTGSFTTASGLTRTFSVKQTDGSNGGTVDLSASTAGTITSTLTDGFGNDIVVEFTNVAGTKTAANASAQLATVGGLSSSLSDVAVANIFSATTTGNLSGGGVSLSGGATVAHSTIGVSASSFSGTYALRNLNLDGVQIDVTLGATLAASSATATVTRDDGTTDAFTLSAVSGSLISTGAKTITLSDTHGNTFTTGFTVATSAATAGDTIRYTLNTARSFGGVDDNPAVQNSSITVDSITKGSASTFDIGSISNSRVVFTATTASAATAAITDINAAGDDFSISGTVDLSTAGTKTVTLRNGSGTSATDITFSFTLSSPLDDTDSLSLELGELGQVVGITSSTSGSTSFAFKVGTGVSSNDSISFSLSGATTSALGISSSTVDTASNANSAITSVGAAITAVASRRADIGASQSRLDFAAASIAVAIENTTAAQSGLLDVDVSAEITEFTSQQVLLQAGVSLLAQANQQPSLLLRLLQ